MKQGFICEKCRSFYESQPDALACETKHIAGFEVIEAIYDKPKDDGTGRYPRRIAMKFGSWVQEYGMSHGYRSGLETWVETIRCAYPRTDWAVEVRRVIRESIGTTDQEEAQEMLDQVLAYGAIVKAIDKSYRDRPGDEVADAKARLVPPALDFFSRKLWKNVEDFRNGMAAIV